MHTHPTAIDRRATTRSKYADLYRKFVWILLASPSCFVVCNLLHAYELFVIFFWVFQMHEQIRMHVWLHYMPWNGGFYIYQVTVALAVRLCERTTLRLESKRRKSILFLFLFRKITMNVPFAILSVSFITWAVYWTRHSRKLPYTRALIQQPLTHVTAYTIYCIHLYTHTLFHHFATDRNRFSRCDRR